MGFTMNYWGLGERYGKPKRKKQNKASKFAFGSMESFEAFESSKAAKVQSPKRKRKNAAKKRKKGKKELTYEEQLKHPMWLKKRDAVLDRYGRQCFRCGSTIYNKVRIKDFLTFLLIKLNSFGSFKTFYYIYIVQNLKN